MRRAARLARPLRNVLTTGRVVIADAEVATSSDMTAAMGPVVATRTAVEMEAVDTEEVSRAADVPDDITLDLVFNTWTIKVPIIVLLAWSA